MYDNKLLTLSCEETTELEILLTAPYPFFSVGETLDSVDGVIGIITHIREPFIFGVFTVDNVGVEVYTTTSRGTVLTQRNFHYSDSYYVEELKDTLDLTELTGLLPIYAPHDYAPGANLDENKTTPPRSWSKTCNCLTLTAFLDYDLNIEWKVFATLRGERLKFPGDTYVYGNFVRKIGGSFFGPYFIGFDVWVEDGDYYVSLCDQASATIEVFKLVGSVFVADSTAVLDPNDVNIVSRRTLLCGLDKRTAYYFTPGEIVYYYQTGTALEIITPTWDTSHGSFVDAIWNHADNTLHMVWEPESYTEDLPDTLTQKTNWGNLYYNSEFCQVNEDGTYEGSNCQGAAFVSNGKIDVSIDFGSMQLDLSVWDVSGIFNTTMRNDVSYQQEYTGTITRHGFFFVGNFIVDLGYNIKTPKVLMRYGIYYSDSSTFTVSAASDLISASTCAVFEGKQVSHTSGLFDVEGGIAANYMEAEYISGDLPCVLSSYTSKTLGDTDISALAVDSFPYDDGWLAVIKDSADSFGDLLPTTVMYKGFIKNSLGEKIFSSKYDVLRGLFLCDTEILDIIKNRHKYLYVIYAAHYDAITEEDFVLLLIDLYSLLPVKEDSTYEITYTITIYSDKNIIHLNLSSNDPSSSVVNTYIENISNLIYGLNNKTTLECEVKIGVFYKRKIII